MGIMGGFVRNGLLCGSVLERFMVGSIEWVCVCLY